MSLLMAWLSIPAVGSIANANLVGSDFGGEISVGFIVKSVAAKNGMCFLIRQKMFYDWYFGTVFWKWCERSRTKLRSVFFEGVGCGGLLYELWMSK